MKLRALIIAASFVMGGCSTLTDYGLLSKEGLRDDEGHLVSHKQLLRNEKTGEAFAEAALLTPLRRNTGELIGYEEQTRDGGALIRDLNGRPIGSRFADSRSRNTNARSRGIAIVFVQQTKGQN